MRGTEGGLLSNYFFLPYSTICMSLEAFRLTSRVSAATMRRDPVSTPSTTRRTTLRICDAGPAPKLAGPWGGEFGGRRCTPTFFAIMVDEPCLIYVTCLSTPADSLSRHHTSLLYCRARRLLSAHPPLLHAIVLLFCMPTVLHADCCRLILCQRTSLFCLPLSTHPVVIFVRKQGQGSRASKSQED
jgi:hypothetical protein